ncbi:hypothetical protein RBH29_11195 [Herbivorax sp. ANBcel31]|uniref:hypothetical protein n=1 Tax=Herbivorax sp. ANBcel31 TaxID=3069754 RepID=UPI0027AF63F2|nr:hypothetical protein [Herbivorax sp. ANBcel31]MDQ2086992.1 hypothetical protein [Herbivorax sp. ANBcel31]
MKRRVFLCLLFCGVLTISGCTMSNQANSEPPKVDVSINGQPISVIGAQSEESASAANLTNFVELVKNKNIEELPYVDLGDSIELVFDFMPEKDELVVYDRLLRKTGADKYAKDTMGAINISLVEKKGMLKIISNPAAMLSSHSEDYEKGKSIRGFSFSVKSEGKNYIYAFAIRTDAKGKVLPHFQFQGLHL